MSEARGGFPGVAAFSLLGLAVVLGAVALAGLRPWATSSIVPSLIPSPGASAALGDATVVARAGSPAVGTGGIAAPASSARASAPVAVSTPKRRADQPVLAVSAGRALEASAPVPVSSPPAPEPAPAPEPVLATPAPPAAQAAPAPPLVASVPGGSPGTVGRPGASVVGGGEPEPGCEGDEYVITVTFEEVQDEEAEDEEGAEAEADILVQRLEADGSTTELRLRGNLTDVRDLVATFVSEGGCVRVDVGPLPGAGPEEEAAGDVAEAAEPAGVAESALP